MLYECDTCDSVFGNSEECQSHMDTLNHIFNNVSLNGDESVRATFRAESESESSEDTDSILFSLGTETRLTVLCFGNDGSASMDISTEADLSSNSSSEQGVKVPTASFNEVAEPERNPAAFTKQWVEGQVPNEDTIEAKVQLPLSYKCGTCSFARFDTWKDCEVHMTHRLHWACQDKRCGRKFDSWNNTSAHQTAKNHWAQNWDPRRHPSEWYATFELPNRWPCEICPTLFTSKDSAQTHMNARSHRAMTKEPQRTDNTPAQDSLLNVLRVQIFRMSCFACSTCGRAFKTTSAAMAHQAATKHSDGLRGVTGFGCRSCELLFASEAQCIKHIIKANHLSSTKRLACPICDDLFYTEKGLENHQAAKGHYQRRRNRNPTTVTNAQAQTWTPRPDATSLCRPGAHEGAFKCETCGATFKLKVAAEQHMTTKKHHAHSDTRKDPGGTYKCDKCSIKFHNEEAKRQHMAATGHRKPLVTARPPQNPSRTWN